MKEKTNSSFNPPDTIVRRPFRCLSRRKVNHCMPYSRDTLPRLGTIRSRSQFELTNLVNYPLIDSGGCKFMLLFDKCVENSMLSDYRVYRLA